MFDPNTSTQNLGNLDRVDYTGAEFEVRGRIVAGFEGYFGLGVTDSNIKESRRAASDVGNEAPWFRGTRPTWVCNTAIHWAAR